MARWRRPAEIVAGGIENADPPALRHRIEDKAPASAECLLEALSGAQSRGDRKAVAAFSGGAVERQRRGGRQGCGKQR